MALVPNTMDTPPVVQQSAGSVLATGNAWLSSALDVWGRVEEIKAQKSSSGQDQLQKMYQPELANGSAIQVDNMGQQAAAGAASGELSIMGIKVNKNLLFFSGVVLASAFALRKMGVA